MSKEDIVKKYLEFLEQSKVDKIVELFSLNGIVDSPLYGVKKATDFYNELLGDTVKSQLTFKDLLKSDITNNIALNFTYKWTLSNNEIVEFDVVDIITLNTNNKIEKLKIIYDTVTARDILNKIKKNNVT